MPKLKNHKIPEMWILDRLWWSLIVVPSHSSPSPPSTEALMQWDSPRWATPCQEQGQDKGPGTGVAHSTTVKHKNLQTRQRLFCLGSILNYFCNSSIKSSRSSFSFCFVTGENLSSRGKKDGTRLTMILLHVPAVLWGCKNAILILRLHAELFCWMGSESSWCKTSELMETMHCTIPSPVREKCKEKMYSILWHSFSELQQILWC